MPKIDLSEPISLRLPATLLADIEQIAGASDRTRSWVIVRALRCYLAAEGAEILDAVEGKRQIENGQGRDFDDVLGEIEAIIRSDKVA